MKGNKYIYHYFYKITNNLNGHFYYGVHNTNNLDDGYMGSGIRLQYAYKKYGIENFTKEILKYFDTCEEAFEYEAEIVTEDLVKDYNCYNSTRGGCTFNTYNLIIVKDNDGNLFSISKDDDRYISGELKFMWCGKHRTDKAKEKIRKTMTPENSKNDHIWVNKNGIVKYLDKRKLNEYLNNGWILGRTGYKPRKGARGKKIEET